MGMHIIRDMTKDQALAHFDRNQSALGRALGVDQSTVNKWRRIPHLRQLQLEALTDGKLKADPECDMYRVPAPKRKKVAA